MGGLARRVTLLGSLFLLAACNGTNTETVDAGIDGSVSSCQAIDASTCYANVDCPSADHCTLSGLNDGAPVTCCVLGPRGTFDAGATCTSLDQCPTAICAYTADYQSQVCSPMCSSNADCPAALPVCFSIDGGVSKFCGLPPP
jgi:hypothetical protein